MNGGARLRMRCLATLGLVLGACSGGTARIGGNDLDYGSGAGVPLELTLRVGESHALLPVSFPLDAVFSVEPGLPGGLILDPATGALSGVPVAATTRTGFTVTATVPGSFPVSVEAEISIAVAPAIPAALRRLADGYAGEVVAGGLSMPSKLAVAADGRLFFTELVTGNVRVVSSAGDLLGTPFATLPVLSGGHRGLLGIALAPGFEADTGHVFVSVSTPADVDGPDRMRVVRFRDGGSNVGVEPTVIVDDLPLTSINNGGALCFDADGHLLISTGDAEDPALAQDDASLAGKVLRVTQSGTVPVGAGDPVFCKGLRNTFALAVHPLTGGIFGADNGPASDDELNFLEEGKNFGWGATPGADFGSLSGFEIHHWDDVVVPTGLAFGDADSRSLFATLYDEEVVLRFRLSGAAYTDVDSIETFAAFAPDQNRHKPLDVQVAEGDGSIYIVTFTAIWRFWRP